MTPLVRRTSQQIADRRRIAAQAFRNVVTLAALVAGVAATSPAQGRTAAASAARPVLDSTAGTPTRLRSWTSDQSKYGLGDLVTVLVVSRTSATANMKDVAADTRHKTLDADVRPPTGPTGASTPLTANLGFDQAGNSRRTGELLRGNEFRAVVTTRVVAISPTGMLRIEGRSALDVDRNSQDIVVTGWIRPQDIAPGTNAVESSRIADASITYARKGKLGQPRTGIVSRVLGMVWP